MIGPLYDRTRLRFRFKRKQVWVGCGQPLKRIGNPYQPIIHTVGLVNATHEDRRATAPGPLSLQVLDPPKLNDARRWAAAFASVLSVSLSIVNLSFVRTNRGGNRLQAEGSEQGKRLRAGGILAITGVLHMDYRVGHSSTTMPRSFNSLIAVSKLRRTLGRSLLLARGDSATAITRP